jgi:hypothetical protein
MLSTIRKEKQEAAQDNEPWPPGHIMRMLRSATDSYLAPRLQDSAVGLSMFQRVATLWIAGGCGFLRLLSLDLAHTARCSRQRGCSIYHLIAYD